MMIKNVFILLTSLIRISQNDLSERLLQTYMVVLKGLIFLFLC